MTLGYDIVVLGRIPDEGPRAWYDRQMAILKELPDSCGVIQVWGSQYAGGEYPAQDGYRWVYPAHVARFVQIAQDTGRRVVYYALPRYLTRNLGSPDASLEYILRLARLYNATFDGVYLDGLGPHGYEVDADECVNWLAALKAGWQERYGSAPLVLQHSSGRAVPSAAELTADYVLYGEHGGPVPEWAGWQSEEWTNGRWCLMSDPTDAQYLAYTAAILRGGAFPIYKMASVHERGERDGYPDGWATEKKWSDTNACLGAHRQWAYWIGSVKGLRDAAELRDVGRLKEPAP